MGLTRHLSGLAVRFDGLALNPPQSALPALAPALPGPRQPLPEPPLLQVLTAWCQEGAGPGGAPWWQPGRPARVAQRLAVAALLGADGTAATDLANQLALNLDGSLRLATLGRAGGLAWRLQVKLADACWWRQRHSADPWDAGWARMAPASVRHLSKHFMPRRATLMLADAADAPQLVLPLAHLQQRAGGLVHPLRWLWVGSAAACAKLPADQRFSLD